MRIIFIALIFYSTVTYSSSYFCASSKATGFKYNENSKSWVTASSNTQDVKYIISKSDSILYKYEVKPIGKKYMEAGCENDFNNHGLLFCSSRIRGYSFRFDLQSGRYLKASTWGYTDVGSTNGFNKNVIMDKDSDTPYIEIGKCSPMP